jgi:uncharacterized protein (DUF2141 family)
MNGTEIVLNPGRLVAPIIILFIFAGFVTGEPGHSGTLKVIVNESGNDMGVIQIALCDTREDYEQEDHAFRTATAPIRNHKTVAVFDSLPYGEYAIKVYHDENENKELDTDFLGIPTEAYGFSNNVRGIFGPADWDDAKFRFSLPVDSILINLE